MPQFVARCCMVLEFLYFYDPPPCRGSGTAPFDAPSSSSLAGARSFSEDLVPPCGAGVAPRWRTGEPFQTGHTFEEPKRHDDDKRITRYIIRMDDFGFEFVWYFGSAMLCFVRTLLIP